MAAQHLPDDATRPTAGREPAAQPPGPDAGPSSPAKLNRRSLWAALKRTVFEFNDDNGWDWAAALTYYSVLSIFPGLLVLVSVIGLIGHRSSVQPVLDALAGVAPGAAKTILSESIAGLQRSGGRAGFAAVIGLAVALWSASGYIGAFMRAANVMYDVPEGRPIWKKIPIRLALTVSIGILLVISAAIVVLSGGLASAVGRGLGLEQQVVTIWNIAKWPVLVILVGLMFALLYRASPNARQAGFRWVSPGGITAVVLWMVASLVFGLYAANFGSYDKTYGTLAGVIIFLVWLWLSNLSLLLGAELDAELERQRVIAVGYPPDEEPYMRLRDTRKLRHSNATER